MSAKRAEMWQAVADKAHLFTYAYVRETLEPIKILGLRAPGVFVCQLLNGTEKDYGCEELMHFGL